MKWYQQSLIKVSFSQNLITLVEHHKVKSILSLYENLTFTANTEYPRYFSLI